MLLFASKKIYLAACRNYRNIWESGRGFYFERESHYSNYCRLSGKINGFNYQVHVNSDKISGLACDLREHYTTDADAIKIFAVACACADYGQYFRKYEHLAKNLVLNY